MDHDELISLILHGIRLAKQVEPSLGRLISQQEMVSKLDEIIRVFMEAKERLIMQQQKNSGSSFLQEYYAKSMMELLQSQVVLNMPETLMKPSNSSSPDHIMGNMEDHVQAATATVAASSSSSQMIRPRRRKDDPEKRTIRVAAPRMGNTEIPPEDGFTWRKYGQKKILRSKFPRGYYRCTHQKLYQCPAKKQVQRLDDDPLTFEVTYRADHTCHMSATAPSTAPPSQPPPPVLEVTHEMTQTMAAYNRAPLPWLEFSLGGCGSGAGPSSTTGGGGGSRPYGKDIDQYLVADLADVMFNSGSSSSNSMELIFTSTSMEDKWDTRDNKKN